MQEPSCGVDSSAAEVEELARLTDSEMQQGRFESAVRLCERVLLLRPNDSRMWHRHAIALLELGDPQRALASLDRALRLAPGSADILQDRALALSRLFRRDEALSCFEESIRQRPAGDRDFHRLSLLVELGRDQEVVELAERLVRQDPNRTDILVTLGWAAIWLGHTEDGLSRFDRLIRQLPGDSAVRMHAAYANLLTGRFDRGLELHEARALGPNPLIRTSARAPEWRGTTPVSGRHLLLYTEQGIGDSLQFCRYIPMLAAAGARVTLEAAPELHQLLSTLEPSLTLAAPGASGPADLQCPLLSLPYTFRTRIDSIPARTPYLRPQPERLARWRERLGPAARPRVGVACSGNPRHTADRRRSMPLALIEPWLALDCEFHLLQNELREADEGFLRKSRIIDHRLELTDLSETAALACCMDLVVTVDTSVAHLAGALGRPVWILLSKPSEWRWLLDRADSPWYPTARLFRTAERGQWQAVIDAVAIALAKIADGSALEAFAPSARPGAAP